MCLLVKGSSPAVAGARLLVVEDNPVNQKIAARALEKLGFEVDVANDGIEAAEAASRCVYALILMDCMMPNMDGYDATLAIRGSDGPNSGTPIVAFTADKTASSKARCFEVGMNEYLNKPLDMPQLKATLDKLIH